MREKESQPASEEQDSGIELAINALEHAFGITDVDYAFQASKPLPNVFLEAEKGSETTTSPLLVIFWLQTT
uniref:Uncharacterized protein n=1 Tax=Ditylenchus dipsaci TaxID=166011 RepID=A0A915CZJ4_9BILA